MGPVLKPTHDHPLLPVDERDRYDEEPCKAALDQIDEKLRKEFEGQDFEPAPSW